MDSKFTMLLINFFSQNARSISSSGMRGWARNRADCITGLKQSKLLHRKFLILLVATHIDERAPDLNYQLYKDTYPQIIGHINVSNATNKGIAELRALLAQCAIKLPVMGQLQPEKWLRAEEFTC